MSLVVLTHSLCFRHPQVFLPRPRLLRDLWLCLHHDRFCGNNSGIYSQSDVAERNIWRNVQHILCGYIDTEFKSGGSALTTTSIPNLPAGNYTFGIQSLVEGASSSFVTAAATIVTAPTSFTATSVGTTISLSWLQATANCSFSITNPSSGAKATTNSNVQYTGATAGSSYTFTLTPCNTAAFVGPSVTTTGTVLSTPTPTAVLSGTNVDVSWPAVAGTSMAYTVSSSPGVPNPPHSARIFPHSILCIASACSVYIQCDCLRFIRQCECCRDNGVANCSCSSAYKRGCEDVGFLSNSSYVDGNTSRMYLRIHGRSCDNGSINYK